MCAGLGAVMTAMCRSRNRCHCTDSCCIVSFVHRGHHLHGNVLATPPACRDQLGSSNSSMRTFSFSFSSFFYWPHRLHQSGLTVNSLAAFITAFLAPYSVPFLYNDCQLQGKLIRRPENVDLGPRLSRSQLLYKVQVCQFWHNHNEFLWNLFWGSSVRCRAGLPL